MKVELKEFVEDKYGRRLGYATVHMDKEAILKYVEELSLTFVVSRDSETGDIKVFTGSQKTPNKYLKWYDATQRVSDGCSKIILKHLEPLLKEEQPPKPDLLDEEPSFDDLPF
jgi:hypothetical protein